MLYELDSKLKLLPQEICSEDQVGGKWFGSRTVATCEQCDGLCEQSELTQGLRARKLNRLN